ncbi:ATP-binding protein [Agrobacterium salinitolerans]|uniref:histidine kinase n=1 Tax=Agrobacterium salinitolerans TaxID=1183413 RepID=A0A9X3KSG4_9HYPH|nr:MULTISPECIES: ATP-binding protein [Agrobacterium]MCZ7853353.1 ATP-binding protein [Agrobacterium salinitolerans]MCZ7893284.1 ATP-binding protein [Agrobacterium salinitolerans]MCZ7940142.1 ATP-binding protein [Agrobacterium salinitolerans]MCZ7977032.1 ATP-binding protein [Agrobacterium salinitolerans]TRA83962.1 GAF domain-containing protein [Agrobacterium salinitolerans]
MSSVTPKLDSCGAEPIHIPGAIQEHGALLVLSAREFSVVQTSDNFADYIGGAVPIGAVASEVALPFLAALSAWYSSEESIFRYVWAEKKLDVSAHRSGPLIIVEVEKTREGESAERLMGELTRLAQYLNSAPSLEDALFRTAQLVSAISEYDRTLIYDFGPDWSGHVVAEAGSGALPSYLGLRFPAGDIPPQARQLYTINRLRMIPDANYRPVPVRPQVNAETGAVLDMSFSQLRSVSPVHLEYMRNMGTAASMSVSIIVNGALWGLIACHHATPHAVSLAVREACDFAAQLLSMRIAMEQSSQDASRRVELGHVQARLLKRMATAEKWVDGLIAGDDEREDLLKQVGADGAALILGDKYELVGKTPSRQQVEELVLWLGEQDVTDVLATDNLAGDYPAASAYASAASGIIAMRVSELYGSWLIWFRPEVIKTVRWGGDPHKTVQESGRIHPRKSFEIWKEQLRGTASAWSEPELAAARELRSAIIGIVLRKAEEMADLTRELQRTNKELEAFSYSVSHDLRAPFRHIVGFAQLLRERSNALDEKSLHYLQMISEAALGAGRLVDDLLNFSQLGRTQIAMKPVDMQKVVSEVRRSLDPAVADRQIEWRIGKLPVIFGDPTLLRQVWYNLIENAIKYSSREPISIISISAVEGEDDVTYSVEDNGVGFDMAYYGKLFGVFQRLQRVEDFEGTGIGLALVRRIVERHHGSVGAEGTVGEGATFSFRLPIVKIKEDDIA